MQIHELRHCKAALGCLAMSLVLAAGCGQDPAQVKDAVPDRTLANGAKDAAAQAAAETKPVAPVAAPPATGPITAGSVELIPVADTSIAAYPQGARSATVKDSEQTFNYGKSTRVKIKRQENMSLFKFDFAKVPAGATITAAEMIVTMDNGKAFNHISAYSMHVDWNEGEGTGNGNDTDKPQTNAETGACFLGPKGPLSRWREYADGDFSHAAAGNGGNASCITRAKDLGNGKWSITIDPLVIEAAMADGQTICLNEETGAWSDTYSNAFVCSREAGADKAPVLKLSWAGERDTVAPAFDGEWTTAAGPLPGSLILNLPKAGDDGKEGQAVGYRVTLDGAAVPAVQIPRPSRFHRELLVTGLTPDKAVAVEVTAFDEAGNTAKAMKTATTGAAWPQTLAESQPLASTFQDAVFEKFTLQVVDGLTLYDPLTGGLSPDQKRVNHGKPAESARLQKAARGDILGFQVLLQLKEKETALAGVQLRLSDFTSADGTIAGAKALFHREHFIKVDVHGTEAWVADPLPVLGAGEAIAIPSQANLPGQKMAAVYVDLHVPVTTKPGTYNGNLIVSPGGDAAEVNVPMCIQVLDVTLPDTLSFVVEMNAYGHADKEKFHATYQLCHAHRLGYNVLSYGHTNGPSDKVLPTSGKGKDLKVSDWSVYDELYGPILSGEIAKGLPRDGVPASHWYLPFHESWPVNLEATDPFKICWEGRVAPSADKAKYEAWLDKCLINDPLPAEHFGPEWREGNTAVAKQFAAHAKEKGWTKTSLQIFSNHKSYFDSGSLSLWVMDEPQYGRDYRALDWMYSFYARALKDTGVNTCLRGDISRPAWMGDRFDEALDLTVSSSSIELDHEIVSRRMIATGKPVWWYGGAGDAATDPAAMTSLFLSKWGLGCDGGLPNWTSVGGPGGWNATGPLRYITSDPVSGKPVATFRMKACREGQEMVELLNVLAAKPGFNRWSVNALVKQAFSVKIVTVSKNQDDPGYSTFEGLDYAALDRLRDKVIATILKK